MTLRDPWHPVGFQREIACSLAIRDRMLRDDMPYALASRVKRYLKLTPEYERAIVERRAKVFLDAEAMSLGYALAKVVDERIGELQ